MLNRRKIPALLLIPVLLLTLLSPAALADDGTFGLVYNSSSVNLRQQPTTDSARVGFYEQGTWIAIHATVGDWYAVTGPDNKSGYMKSSFIDVNHDNIGNVGIVANPEGTAFLNLRAAPSFTAKVLGIYYNGVPCILLGLTNGWYHVRVDGVEGYFKAEFIQPELLVYSEHVATISTPDHGGMNMRTGPDTTYSIAHQFKDGQYVMILKQGKEWWRVSCDGYVGYMKASFLKEGVYAPDGSSSLLPETTGKPVITPAPPAPTTGYATVTNPKESQVLNMRAQPNSTAQVLARYANGATVTVLKQGIEWCKIRNSSGVVGYMMTDFLTLHNMP